MQIILDQTLCGSILDTVLFLEWLWLVIDRKISQYSLQDNQASPRPNNPSQITKMEITLDQTLCAAVLMDMLFLEPLWLVILGFASNLLLQHNNLRQDQITLRKWK